MSPAVALQYLLPHRPLSALARVVARSEWKPLKNFLIHQVHRRFGVDLDEAIESDPDRYPSFNAFFTRALKPGARRQPEGADVLSIPADGRLSRQGRIEHGRIFQAKGQDYTAAELLGDPERARAFEGGDFVNIYLSPRDYHRVHMPWAGHLTDTLHIPGRLFSVAPWAVDAIPRLFARNERLVCHFETDFGPMAIVMVGAILVSGVETVWGGEEIPPYAASPRGRDWRARNVELGLGDEMARFNYGSTVILLFPPGAVELTEREPQSTTRLGEPMAHRVQSAG
jgi:phosphatidylserine decarboxylase